MDCDSTIGLLSQISAIFGLPPASVVHEECQVRARQSASIACIGGPVTASRGGPGELGRSISPNSFAC